MSASPFNNHSDFDLIATIVFDHRQLSAITERVLNFSAATRK